MATFSAKAFGPPTLLLCGYDFFVAVEAPPNALLRLTDMPRSRQTQTSPANRASPAHVIRPLVGLLSDLHPGSVERP